MPFTALDEVLAVTGELAGKLVVDCTNAVERGALKYGHTARRRRSCRSGCRKRRCSSRSTPRAENLENPSYDGLPSTNFFCGDDSEGRKVMKQLVEDVGFDAMDAGPLKNARLLWVASSKALGARDLAFRVVRR